MGMFLHNEEPAPLVSREDFREAMATCFYGHGCHYEINVGPYSLPVWVDTVDGWTNTQLLLFLSPRRGELRWWRKRKENLYWFKFSNIKKYKVWSAVKQIFKTEGLSMPKGFKMKKKGR